MENVASFALMLAFVLVVYGLLASLVGIRQQKERLQYSAYRATVAIWALVTVAIGILVYSLMTNDFRLAAVAGGGEVIVADIERVT